ncbi:hypothetical protein LTS10_010059 [Elasticomyces elasticus]|nr:hypothetical protein LTS10_010059 [Elasticomyces elasticus]
MVDAMRVSVEHTAVPDKPESTYVDQQDAESLKQGTATDDELFPLFDLPPEIWIRIVRLAVTKSRPINLIEPLGPQTAEEFQHAAAQPAITRVCWSVRTESLRTFYANAFVYTDECTDAKQLYSWLEKIMVERRHELPALIIESWHDDVVTYFTDLLEDLELKLQEVGRRNATENELANVKWAEEGEVVEIVIFKVVRIPGI